jgi:hypothetical protein
VFSHIDGLEVADSNYIPNNTPLDSTFVIDYRLSERVVCRKLPASPPKLRRNAMTHRIRVLLLSVLAGIVAVLLLQVVTRAAQAELTRRIAHTDPAAFRPQPAVHGGAGTMSFTAILNRGAVTPEFNFLHRGEIPPGAGIGHHFHNTVEEMFIILDGEAQFTIDGRTALVKGPAGVICRTRSITPVQSRCSG